jgi:AhpD family alkylhydroperoxidase
MNNDSMYKVSNRKKLAELGKLAPETFKAFTTFNQQTMSSGVLPAKLKELIAVAIAHVTGCPYCIDSHTKNAKKLGVTLGELAESIFVATALKAGSACAHSVNALNAYDDSGAEDLYLRANRNRMKEFWKINDNLSDSFSAFNQQVFKPGLLDRKEKELIAVAVAHVTGCPYCIDSHTKNAKKLGVTLEELAESIFVATALKAGSAYAHSINALIAYED